MWYCLLKKKPNIKQQQNKHINKQTNKTKQNPKNKTSKDKQHSQKITHINNSKQKTHPY